METLEQLLFGPDAVLPVQLHPTPAMSPEKRLMLAVLEDALRICTGRDRVRRRLLVETMDWLFSDDTRAPFSFINVCQALGLDSAALRADVRRSMSAPVPVAPVLVAAAS